MTFFVIYFELFYIFAEILVYVLLSTLSSPFTITPVQKNSQLSSSV